MFKLVVLSALVALACAAPKISLPRLDGRIVGGEDVSIEDYPHQISLQYYGSHRCGGSIIANKWVVTAAHCTDGIQASSLAIRAGSVKDSSGGVLVNVAKIHQNPKYDSSNIDYDITVLELEEDLTYGSAIQPIDLPALNQAVPAGSKAICTGWGALTEGGSSPDILQGVTLDIIDQDECNEANYGGVTDRMLCAGVDGGGKDACQGDSGGPLVVDGKLVGVVSWGYGCARPDFPGVYSSVPNMRDFITESSGI